MIRKNPIKNGHDSNGDYYQWGDKKRYYYDSSSANSRTSAYNKARKQASAIFASGYQPKRNPRIPFDGMEDRRNATKRSISDMTDSSQEYDMLRRNSAITINNFQEVKGVVTGFNAKITYVDDGDGNEIELDIDDIEAVSMTPIDDMEMDASCHFTYIPMVSSDGEFHGNYLKTFDWWYE